MDVAPLTVFHWWFVFCTLPGLQMTEIENIYVTIGSDVNIKCPNAKVNTWQYFESKKLLCDLLWNGQNSINPNLTASDRLNVTSDCQLLIQNFTTTDICTYFCYEKKNDSKGYKLHVQLRNLTIDGTDHFGVIQSTEGTNLTLRCIVTGFLLGDKTYWTTNNKLLVSGKTRSLNHTLTAHRSYNMNEFTCTTENSKETQPLIAHVRLNLILKPSVFITVSVNSGVRKKGMDVFVRQGKDIELQCREKDNESKNGVIFRWLYNGNMFQNNTNVIILNKIKPETSGLYTCNASNKAGRDSDTVNIIVTYFPLVQTEDITFNGMNRPRTLNCNVSGEPNTYILIWRHYTYNNQLIRMFNKSTSGMLILPEGEADDLVFEDSGFYICNVTNGIPDDCGKLWQSGKIKVMVEGSSFEQANGRMNMGFPLDIFIVFRLLIKHYFMGSHWMYLVIDVFIKFKTQEKKTFKTTLLS
ncbi:Hypothetical predicted protein [Mytilus galloprovincialis]|uniref:Ig-like domain-containing protein n=1 Tax=Mytilus galloprovincialis TaxID=29158 RepID=A0A8B6FNZ5_MYTGA|nr:Hypothetical predicted protein [Mytilus galloprovincialis]